MRRDAFSLKIAIMKTLREPIINTRIMQKTGINCNTIKLELKKLILKNLATTTISPKKPKFNNHRVYYILTPEGTEILNSILKARIVLMEPS